MHINDNEKEILGRAISTWGEVAQLEIFLEELGELNTSINKRYGRKGVSDDIVATEVADVEICLKQVCLMLCDEVIEEQEPFETEPELLLIMTEINKIGFDIPNYFINRTKENKETFLFSVSRLCKILTFLRGLLTNEKVNMFVDLKLIRLDERLKKYA